jgi:hypothetical protein
MTQAWLGFRDTGMPFTLAPRSRVIATGRACRVVVAARMEPPALEAVEVFDHGLTTREVALVMAAPSAKPDDRATAEELIHNAATGQVACVPIGNDAVRVPKSSARFERLRRIREMVSPGS